MLSRRLKNIFLTLMISAGAILLIVPGAHAIPSLQLDIGGGTYDWSTQTIVTTSDTFTLYAYLIVNDWNDLSDTYYISAAVAPSVDTSIDLGSFSFDGETVNVTESMTYGEAPLEGVVTDSDWGDSSLPSHGIFPTYFAEFDFMFSGTDITPYNTQDDPGGPADLSGTGMYYASFEVDVSLLDPDYGIHFDLYNIEVFGNGKHKTMFAPFSHDAATVVPEPSTILLLGVGMLGLWGLKRRFGFSPDRGMKKK
jgi:hypothetical protein